MAAIYAKRHVGYKHVVLLGLSGGAWATTVTAAILPSIVQLSIPVAGTLPKWPTFGWPKWIVSHTHGCELRLAVLCAPAPVR
jgi:hypothetical protein